MAKIAVELEQALADRVLTGAPGRAMGRRLAQGNGWTVADVVCTSGPQDRPFEERHTNISIAIVVAGSFQYRNTLGSELMTPGSLLLGNMYQCFECRHDHGSGDRCLSFSYTPEYFEKLASEAGSRAFSAFHTPRLPPERELSSLVARASACLTGSGSSWEELSLELAGQVVQSRSSFSCRADDPPPSTISRVTRVVRMIERDPNSELSLADLAQEARLSPYHFLRTFRQLTGLTPHQYILRARLREAARLLVNEPQTILDIAFECGFGDVSNFNRVFRAEFGVSPRVFRRQAQENVSID